MQSWAPAGDPAYAVGEEFADLVAEMSDGRLVIEVYASGGILPKKKELEGLAKGVVEAIQEPHGWMRTLLPASGAFSATCGGLTGTQAILWWMEGGGNELAEQHYAEVGVKFVAPQVFDPAEVWVHCNKPINSLADLKGLKMRAGGEVGEIFEKYLEVSSVLLAGGEIYESMQRGVIDAFEYVTPNVNWAMGFQEIADYMYISPARMPHDKKSLLVTQDAWDALSPDLQKIVFAASWHVAPRSFAESLIRDEVAIQNFKDYGTIVEFLNPEIEVAVLEAAAKFYADKVVEDPWYGEIYESKMRWREICEASGIK